MLPQTRDQEHLFAVPKFAITKGDVKKFINEIKEFHEVFSDYATFYKRCRMG
jgi:hypothetical protein